MKLLSKVGLKMLKNVEVSAQEGAWFLLRNPMSMASREIVAIPTMCPEGRIKGRKCKRTMDRENLPSNSTDIWTKSLIEKYENHHSSLVSKNLAQFVAWYSA